MSQREIEDLVEQLQQARDAYYNDDPTMSDAEYDALEDELRELDPKHVFFKQVGAKAEKSTKWEKVKHSAPMGSLMKVQIQEEFDKWAADVEVKLSSAERAGDIANPGREIITSEKLDGISLSLEYKKGKFVRGLTRGDGITGEDISRNVRLMEGFVGDAQDLTGFVRAEIILKKSNHKKHVPEYKNPRNAASGIAKRESDPKPCAYLTVVCYQVISDEHKIKSKSVEFKLLKALGFTTPNWKKHKPKDVSDYYQDYVAGRRDKLDYEIDGLVIEFEDLRIMEHLGDHDGRPKGARAFKFPHAQQSTLLREIVWQVGNSGRVTPVAYFDTVELAGASVSQASLHNPDNLLRLAMEGGCPQQLLGLNDKILVSRRNDVIPYVEKVIAPSQNARFATPTECPSCGTKLKRNRNAGDFFGSYLVCDNEVGCMAQVSGAVKRWVQKLDIKDFGSTLIETVCENGMVSSIADIYGLDEDALAAVTMSGKKVGKSTAKKVLKNLHAKKDLRIADFVGSLGIDLWGRSMVKMLVDAGIDTIDKMEDAAVRDIGRVPKVGETKAVAFVEGFGRRKKLIDDLLAAGVTVRAPIVGGKLSGVSFCFTGIRDPSFSAQIEDAGGAIKGSVGKGLTYLVAKDPKSTSGKAKKARALGTKVISLEEAKGLL